jgi:hypothetical protein
LWTGTIRSRSKVNAYWADRQITTKLFGHPVSTDEASAHASDRYLKLHASPMRARAVEQQRRATESVARLIDTRGLDTFNRVWTDANSVPTNAETGTPDLWQRRFGRGAACPAVVPLDLAVEGLEPTPFPASRRPQQMSEDPGSQLVRAALPH